MTIAGLGRLPLNNVMQYPTGRWGFVGTVDGRLAAEHTDGTPLTEQEMIDCRKFGRGLFKNIRSRSWETREEAIAAADAIGAEVSNR